MDKELELNSIKRAYEDTISLFLEITNDLNMDLNQDELLELYMRELRRVVDYRSTVFISYNGDKDIYVMSKMKGYDRFQKKSLSKLIKDGLVLWAGKLGRPFVLKEETEETEILTHVIVPIVIQEKMIGALLLNTMYTEAYFTKNKMKILEIVTSRISAAFENMILYQDLGRRNQKLRALKNYMDNVVQNMTDGIFVMDEDGVIRVFNKKMEEFLQLNSIYLIGRTLNETPLDTKFVRDLNRMLSNADENSIVNIEIDYELSEEEKIPFELSVKTIVDMGHLVVMRDLRASKELMELKRVDKLKDEFLSMVSHELRTPLTSIKAYAETMMDMVEEDSMEREFLSIINEESDRLNTLINDILDLSKIEAGKMEFRFGDYDMNQVVERAVKNMESFANQKSITLNFQADEKIGLTQFDKDRILQVLLNLINNAIKFSEEESEIIVKTLQKKKNLMQISIKDSGLGIAEKDLEAVFEKFKQTEDVLKRSSGGTGLGLPICKNIVEYHGGRIWVESVLGEGSTFYFTIPEL